MDQGERDLSLLNMLMPDGVDILEGSALADMMEQPPHAGEEQMTHLTSWEAHACSHMDQAMPPTPHSGSESSSAAFPNPSIDGGPRIWSELQLAIAQHSVHKVETVEGTDDKEYVVSNLRKFTINVVLVDKSTHQPVNNQLQLRVRTSLPSLRLLPAAASSLPQPLPPE